MTAVDLNDDEYAAGVILAEVADRCGTTVDAIRGPHRSRVIWGVRREAYQALRDAGFSFPEIARACGRRNHTTILKVLRAEERRRAPAAA